MRLTVLALVVALTLWSGFYAHRVTGIHGEWLTWLDALFLGLMSMSMKWTVPAEWIADGQSWLVPFVSFAAVSYQIYARAWTGAACALGLTGAMVAGLVIALPLGAWSDSLITAGWSLVLCLLGRMLRILVERGGRAAHQASVELEELRRDRDVAVAVRSDERRLLDALHDTAASTLLMVGMGVPGGPAGDGRQTLIARAGRDLAVLASMQDQPPAEDDLIRSIRAASVGHGIEVIVEGPDELARNGAVVRALAGAAGEAVRNAARHAGVTGTLIRVNADRDRVQIEIIDRGAGFDSDAVGAGRRGIRESIVRRVRDVGGSATIDSIQGVGTVVRLGWPA